MFLFGHLGLTFGTALLADKLQRISSRHIIETAKLSEASESGVDCVTENNPGQTSFSFKRFDLRLVLLGSLLPDIIDKPLGMFLLRNTFSNGRIISHTLLFLILLFLVGFYLYKIRCRLGLLAISFGVMVHLILDQMWTTPQTLLWPFLGFTFVKENTAEWIPNMWHALLHDPGTYIPEIIGVAILAWFAVDSVRNKRFTFFLRRGTTG